MGGSFTLHSAGRLFPTLGGQMSFGQNELRIARHWASSSSIPERYDRGVFAAVPPLLSAIARNFASERERAQSPTSAGHPE